MSSAVWLITGSSSGFGTALALHVLNAGQRVVATVRSKTKSSDAVSRLESAGAKIIEMDLAAGDAAIVAATKTALQVYGNIDVIVNNAGYAVIGAVEDIDDVANRAQIETNYFGPLSLIRAVLPCLRAQGSGVIVNVSSTAGLDGQPSSAIYSASKFALEGVSEGLAKELAPLGIGVLLIEPGAFQTNFQGALSYAGDGVGQAYRGGLVEIAVGKLREMAEKKTQGGDPVKGARVMFEAVERIKDEKREDVKRQIMGSDAVKRLETKISLLQRDLNAGRDIAKSADV